MPTAEGALEQCKDSWHLLSQHLWCWCGGCAPLRDAARPSAATHGPSTARTAPCGALAALHDMLALDHVLVSFVDIKHFMLARAVASCGFDSRTGSG